MCLQFPLAIPLFEQLIEPDDFHEIQIDLTVISANSPIHVAGIIVVARMVESATHGLTIHPQHCPTIHLQHCLTINP